MKIDFAQSITDLNGDPVLGEDGAEFTLRSACIAALFVRPQLRPGEKPPSWEENMRRDVLARSIYGAKEPVDISSEDVVLLKPLLAEAWLNPIVVAACCRLLEGKPQDGSSG